MQPNYADLISLVRQAGAAVLEIYNRSDYTVVEKEDESPLTEADLAANEILVHGLPNLTSSPLPIISEEAHLPSIEERAEWQRFWLIDPIDGTKEFIERSGDFTINVALIENGEPVFGMIYVPVTGECFYGGDGKAFLKIGEEPAISLKASSVLQRIREKEAIRIMSSKRHGAEEVSRLCENLQEKLAPVQKVAVGSSLKLAYVAAGKGELYPRFGNVSEWDIAAGHAILKAVGGDILNMQYESINYQPKPQLIVPGFYAVGDRSFDWRPFLLT